MVLTQHRLVHRLVRAGRMFNTAPSRLVTGTWRQEKLAWRQSRLEKAGRTNSAAMATQASCGVAVKRLMLSTGDLGVRLRTQRVGCSCAFRQLIP